MKKILSIDFDYFPDVSQKIIANSYPDGRDFNSAFSTMIWSSYYTNTNRYKKDLENVSINKRLYEQLIHILFNQDKDCHFLIAQSHLHIYDFIHQYFDTDEELEIDNIDFHPDYSNTNNIDVDCGNWLGNLNKEYDKLNIQWMCRKESMDLNPCEEIKTIFQDDLSTLFEDEFDLIFLCRSNNWLPPHLDKDFDELVSLISIMFNKVLIDKDVEKPRDYLDLVKQTEQAYKNMGIN